MAARSADVVTGRRRMSAPWLMVEFWQYAQRRLQPPKNTVPDPRVPDISGSSPKCAVAAATTAPAGRPQMPLPPAARSTAQRWGHRRQGEARPARAMARSASSPVSDSLP